MAPYECYEGLTSPYALRHPHSCCLCFRISIHFGASVHGLIGGTHWPIALSQRQSHFPRDKPVKLGYMRYIRNSLLAGHHRCWSSPCRLSCSMLEVPGRSTESLFRALR